MTLSKIGRTVSALVASAALGLGMTACGGGTIGYMWILGTANSSTAAAGAITGYKIDDYTGNLTAMDHSPYSSGGSNPQMLVVKTGGRFVFVVNSGTSETGSPNSTTNPYSITSAAINVFAVGGGGVLTAQQSFQSQGSHPLYLAFDQATNYLYVLDKYSPNYCAVAPCKRASDGLALNQVDLNGSITAFSVASDTGKLTLIANTSVRNPDGTPTTFFEVGPSPVMTKLGGGGCLYTITNNAVYPYVISSSNGQLVFAQNGPQAILGATNLTSINTSQGTSSQSFVYLTDGPSNSVLSLQTSGTPCSLSPVPASTTSNIVSGVVPVNSLTSTNGQFLYVLNQGIPGSTTQTQASSISAFTIQNGLLQPLSTDATTNPYAVGSGPTCMVEDPSSQYAYISNSVDSTVQGKLLDVNRGFLSDLKHGSTFPTVQNPTCLAVSGNL